MKIPPESIGVGLYQHSLPTAVLKRALGETVDDCVNAVGIDLNTASPPLLQRVSGLSPRIASNIAFHRDKSTPFSTITQLNDVLTHSFPHLLTTLTTQVDGIGPVTFLNAAGTEPYLNTLSNLNISNNPIYYYLSLSPIS